MPFNPTLRQLRYDRTRSANRLRSWMQYMQTCDAAGYTLADGLPSWWPFHCDVLARDVRDALTAARQLDLAEGTGYDIHARP